MEIVYPFMISFLFVFLSELGDKTQLLVLSFSAKQKTATILLGVALGSLLSHGLAIWFGSALGVLENPLIGNLLQLITYLSFLGLGVWTLFKKEKVKQIEAGKNPKIGCLQKIAKWRLNYIFFIAATIAVGEIGDKTFLASLGLGIEYSNYKVALIIGAVIGMVISDLLAIILGKVASHKIQEKTMERFSGILFLLFGILGLIRYFSLI